MAEILKQQLRNFEQKTKPFLYDGPFQSQWGFVEQKTKIKRDQFTLGRVLFTENYFHSLLVFSDEFSFNCCCRSLLGIWLGK